MINTMNIFMFNKKINNDFDQIKLLVLLSSGALQLSNFCLSEPQLSRHATAPDNRARDEDEEMNEFLELYNTKIFSVSNHNGVSYCEVK